jgi:hypothetical protein
VGFAAWGEETGDLQAVELVVRVRQAFIERPPAVTDGDAKAVSLPGVTALEQRGQPYDLKHEPSPASERRLP